MSSVASLFKAPPKMQLGQTTQTDYGKSIQGGQELMGGAAGAMQQLLPQGQDLISTLKGLSQGKGPSLAQTMLRQQTGQNVAGSAGAAASTTGLSPALQKRLGRMMGAGQVQQAAGQGAVARVGEQLGALSGIGTAIGQQAHVASGIGNIGNALFGTGASSQNTQSSINVQNMAQYNQMRQQQFEQQQQLGVKLLGSAAAGASGLSGLAGLPGVPEVPGVTGEGGFMSEMPGSLSLGNFNLTPPMAKGGVAGKGDRKPELAQKVMQKYFGGGKVSKHEKKSKEEHKEHPWTTMKQAERIASDHGYAHGGDYRGGGKVPGQARNPNTDTESNDTVHAMLTPGEGVVPLTKMKDPDAAAEFARNMAERAGAQRGSKERYLEKRRRAYSRGGRVYRS